MISAKDCPNTVELVAEKVHEAWMKEKLAQGFHAPKNCPSLRDGETYQKFKKYCDKCHTDLYPYSELPENVKEYDRVTVIAVLNAINYFEGKTCTDCFEEVEQEPTEVPCPHADECRNCGSGCHECDCGCPAYMVRSGCEQCADCSPFHEEGGQI